MTRLSFLLLSIMALLTMPVWAGSSSDEVMRAAATRVLKSSRPLELVAYYPGMAVYRQAGGGFAVVSTNEKYPAVLAYSRQGDLNLTGNNPGFNWWLNATRKVLLQSVPRRDTTKPDPSRFAASVQPLLTTVWGQREPFKFMCPFDTYVADNSLYGTYQPDSGHYSLGCGPAAMAQYMYYYKYPKRGTGTGSVDVKYKEGTVKLTVDFESVNYDWGNMIDDYQGEYSTEQGLAVAQLCYHCGVAAETTWNSYGGGTTDATLVKAFIDHFDYNDTAHYVPRSRYDEPTWMEMVYTELSAGHPIFYSAKDLNLEAGIIAGHNFIIDGYDENGLVHVNWGWYGLENGYFDLALLDVRQYTYDDWQAMYVGLYPNREELTGDVNLDGKVSIEDVTELISYLLSGKVVNTESADVNGDGKVNIEDVTEVITILLTRKRLAYPQSQQ